MKASKIFHFVGIAGLAIALFGHSIGALMTQLDPIGNLGGVYNEMKLLQLQKKTMDCRLLRYPHFIELVIKSVFVILDRREFTFL